MAYIVYRVFFLQKFISQENLFSLSKRTIFSPAPAFHGTTFICFLVFVSLNLEGMSYYILLMSSLYTISYYIFGEQLV